MKSLTLVYTGLALSSFFTLAALGCSSKTTDADAGTTADSGGGPDSSSPARDAGVDALDPSDPEGNCTVAGGQVATQPCCSSTGDFPSSCGVGACGCDADASKPTKVCNCPAPLCWNGVYCMSR